MHTNFLFWERGGGGGGGFYLLVCTFLFVFFPRMIDIQGRDVHFGDVRGNVFKIGLLLVAYKSISFKLGMMIRMAKF